MKNKIIYYILFGLVIFCIIYIICSNNLFKISKNSKQNNGQASKMSIQRTIEENNNTEEKNEQQENNNTEENNEQVEQTEEKVDETTTIQENTIKQDIEDKNKIPEKMGGYNVLGRLVIEKVNVSINILNVSNEKSLKVSAVKLYGPNINEVGNFCICGHNWKSMLKRVLELEVGDTFYLIDRETLNKVNYKIYNIYTCMPKDLECLNQNTEGKRESTIITCNPGGITRLIIKGKEI